VEFWNFVIGSTELVAHFSGGPVVLVMHGAFVLLGRDQTGFFVLAEHGLGVFVKLCVVATLG
jgi:hypothetical protein